MNRQALEAHPLIQPVMRIFRKVGIDLAVFYTAGTKLFQAAVQFAVLGALAKNLSPFEQGYYYTFQSVLALQIFFELGMTSVLIQVTSHEAATLDLARSHELQDSSTASERLSSLLHHLIRWYLVASTLFFVSVFVIGLFFFYRSNGGLLPRQWVGAWLLSTFMTAISMTFQAIIAFTEGIGRINAAAKVRAALGISTVLTLFASMSIGGGLYSPGLSLLVGISVGALFLLNGNRAILISIWWKHNPSLIINWTKSLWGFQWRMALSWISGYLIFQFSTPVVFKLLGSVEAGKYGITQQVANGISALSMAWATTRQARWGRWIAINDRASLDADFKATLKRTVGVNIALSAVFLGFMVVGSAFLPEYLGRFAPIEVAITFLACGVLNQVVFTEAIYLRAHKTEPFLITSVSGAIAMGVGSLFVARHGIFPISLLYLSVTIFIGLLWGTKIFFSEKRKWEALSRANS